jgi:hypothetical protein
MLPSDIDTGCNRSQGGSPGSDQNYWQLLRSDDRIVDAASLTMPINMIARKMSYRELVDYDTAGVVYSYNTVTTLKHTPGKSREVT